MSPPYNRQLNLLAMTAVFETNGRSLRQEKSGSSGQSRHSRGTAKRREI